MRDLISIVLPKSFEDYDDCNDFLEQAKCFLDNTNAIEYWKENGVDIFTIDIMDKPNREE